MPAGCFRRDRITTADDLVDEVVHLRPPGSSESERTAPVVNRAARCRRFRGLWERLKLDAIRQPLEDLDAELPWLGTVGAPFGLEIRAYPHIPNYAHPALSQLFWMDYGTLHNGRWLRTLERKPSHASIAVSATMNVGRWLRASPKASVSSNARDEGRPVRINPPGDRAPPNRAHGA